MATLAQYNNWKDRLINLIDITVAQTREMAPDKADLYEKLSSQLKEDTLKVQVVGTVKNGKSSFTNALIGEQILPVDDLPCTAISSEVKYGPKEKAVVSFCSPLPVGLLDSIPSETRNYLQAHNFGKDASGRDVTIPPFEIPYGMMSDYVKIPEPSIEVMMDPDAYNQFKEKIAKESPYDVARLYFPAKTLRNGVMFIDSPGLNEHPKRTEVTLSYLKQADAVIYLLNAAQPVTMEEKRVIEKVLLPLGFKDILMVGNKIDLVSRREKSRLYMEANVREYTSIPKCFGVSAKEYFDGLEAQSGIPEFKKFLIDFLTKKKGELKINKTAYQIVNSIKADFLESLIPSRLDALQQNSVMLQNRVNDARPKLAAIEAQRTEMSNKFEANIPLALVPVKEAVNSFFNRLQQQISQWIGAYIPAHNYGLYVNKSDLKIISEEIMEFVKKHVENEYNKWNENTLQPILEEQCKFVFGNMEEEMKAMAVEIACIENILNGAEGVEISASNVMERMAGIAAMAFLPLGRAGGELFAGGLDAGKFLKSFMVDLGVGLGVGLVALYVWPPLGLIVSFIGIVVGLLQGSEHKINSLKQKIIDSITGDLTEKASELVAKVLDDIRGMFNDVTTSMLKALDSEIATSKGQLEELIRITTADQQALDSTRTKLEERQRNLESVVDGMTLLTQEVSQANATA